jgi:Lhr-like helicase
MVILPFYGGDLMASQLELQIWQKDKLYTLLTLKALNKDIEIVRLAEMIHGMEAIMQEVDVAWVEKKIRERYGD